VGEMTQENPGVTSQQPMMSLVFKVISLSETKSAQNSKPRKKER
jgi:hypothetical protein